MCKYTVRLLSVIKDYYKDQDGGAVGIILPHKDLVRKLNAPPNYRWADLNRFVLRKAANEINAEAAYGVRVEIIRLPHERILIIASNRQSAMDTFVLR